MNDLSPFYSAGGQVVELGKRVANFRPALLPVARTRKRLEAAVHTHGAAPLADRLIADAVEASLQSFPRGVAPPAFCGKG